MQSIALSAILNVYVFPTGRRLFAFTQVEAIAKAQGFSELAKHCSAAIAEDRACLGLEKRWAGLVAVARGKAPSLSSAGSSQPDAASIDPLVDRTLTAIRDHAVNQTAGAPADDPIHATVSGFLREIFPTSVNDITGLAFVEELAAVELILAALQGKSLAPVVKELGLGRLTKRLADLTVQYRAALEAPAPETIAFGEVRAARIRAHELLLEAIAIVIGQHHGSSPEEVAKRTELLRPIFDQNEAIGAALRGRRAIADVNPETGIVDNAAAPGDPVASGAPAEPDGGKANG